MIRTIILKCTSCLISFEHSNKIVQVSKLCVQIFWPKLFDPKLMHLLSFSSLLLLLLLLIWKWCLGFCFDREVEEISRGEVLHCGHPLVGLVVERLNLKPQRIKRQLLEDAVKTLSEANRLNALVKTKLMPAVRKNNHRHCKTFFSSCVQI